MSETKTAMSDKFYMHKKLMYINEVKQEDYKYTKLVDLKSDFTSGSIAFDVGEINSVFDMRKAFFRVKFIYTKADGSALAAGDIATRSGITIENNWFYNCFSQITLRVNNIDLEIITNPGEVDSALKHIYYQDPSKQVGDISGWIPDKGDGGSLNFGAITTPTAAFADVAAVKTYLDNTLIPNLTPLVDPKNINVGFIERKKRYPVAVLAQSTPYEQDFPIYPLFGFFEQNRVWKGALFYLELVIRQNYQQNILFGSTTDVALKIVDVQLMIPKYDVVEPVLDFINDQIKKPIQVSYLTRTYKRLQMADTKSSEDWELGNSKKRARYIFVWFKPSNRNGKRTNADLYYLQSPAVAAITAPADGSDVAIPAITAFNLVDIRLSIDGQYYPVKAPLVLNPSSNDINDLIKKYQDMAINPQYQPYEFVNIHGIICFDLTAQTEHKAKVALSRMLTINKNGNQALDVHCLILEETASLVNPDLTSIKDIPL